MTIPNDSGKILYGEPSEAFAHHSPITPMSEKTATTERIDSSTSSVDIQQIEHVPEGTASPGKALFMLLKAFVGTGVIFLPGSYVSAMHVHDHPSEPICIL